MKRFVIKIAFFAFITIVLLELTSYAIRHLGWHETRVNGKEVYRAINKSKQPGGSTVLLGDSVGNQIFSNRECNENPNSLACNQAVSMAGHYMLLRNYIDAGNTIDTLYYVGHPFSFQNNLDQIYTFHYFLKPFDTEAYRSLHSQAVKEQTEKIPFNFLARSNMFSVIDWAPNYQPEVAKEYLLSPISIEYLERIKQLSEAHSFVFRLIPTPMRTSLRDSLEGLDISNYKGLSFEKEIEAYLDGIMYIDDVHFKDVQHLHNAIDYREKVLSSR